MFYSQLIALAFGMDANKDKSPEPKHNPLGKT